MINSMNFLGYITLKDYPQSPSDKTLIVLVPDKLLPEFCLNLIMLSDGRLEAVRLVSGLAQEVYLHKVMGHKKRNGTVSWSAHRIDVMASKNILDGLTNWMSEYHTTGTSPVNHADVEFSDRASGRLASPRVNLNLVVGIEHGTPPIRM